MHVLERDDQRPLLREAREVEPCGAVELVAHRLPIEKRHLGGQLLGQRHAEQCREVGQDLRGVVAKEAGEASRELLPALRLTVVAVDAGVLLDDLEEGPVADAAAEGERAALEPADAPFSGAESQFLDEARLADASLTGDEQQATLAAAQLVDGLQAGGELGFAADHGCRPCHSRSPVRGVDLAGEPRLHGFRLTLERQRRECRVGEGVRRELVCQGADHEAHRRRRCLEAGSRVDRIAGEEAAS